MHYNLVSIIIPTYNSSRYINESINYIKKQTYKKWELIFVDDGSIDNTVDLIKLQMNMDNRIKLIVRDREPKGSVVCRNIGQSVARGAYIIHFDSDDIISEYCLEQRVRFMDANNNIDYATFRGRSVILKNKKLISTGKDWGIITSNDILKDFLEVNYSFSVWNNIYRSKIFKNILWDENVKIYTDFSYIIPILLNNYNHQFVENSVPDYFYITGRQKAMTSNFLTDEKYESTKYLLSKTMKQLEKVKEYRKYKNNFKKFFLFQMKRIIISGSSRQKCDFYKFYNQYYKKSLRLNIVLFINKYLQIKHKRLFYEFIFAIFFSPKELSNYIKRKIYIWRKA